MRIAAINFTVFFLVLLASILASTSQAGGVYGTYPVGLPPDLWGHHTASGLIKIPHDLNDDGKVDIELIYTIRATFWTDAEPDNLIKYYPNQTLLTVPAGDGLTVYVIGEYPLFYWYDLNSDGDCDFALHDPTESGFQYGTFR